jgi:hypothetical protein
MFDDIERIEELRKIWNEAKWNFRIIDFINKIVSQEKSMIEQAKKEAVKEFAEKLKQKEYDSCPTCKGKGSAYDDETGIETCPDCRGNGEIK